MWELPISQSRNVLHWITCHNHLRLQIFECPCQKSLQIGMFLRLCFEAWDESYVWQFKFHHTLWFTRHWIYHKASFRGFGLLRNFELRISQAALLKSSKSSWVQLEASVRLKILKLEFLRAVVPYQIKWIVATHARPNLASLHGHLGISLYRKELSSRACFSPCESLACNSWSQTLAKRREHAGPAVTPARCTAISGPRQRYTW